MRKLRITTGGARYHVTARANHQKLLLEHDTVKQMFLDVIPPGQTSPGYQWHTDGLSS